MAGLVGTLRANVEAQFAKFSTAMDQVADKVDQTGARVGKSSKKIQAANDVFADFGKTLRATGAATGLFFVGKFVTDSAQAADAAEELREEVQNSFGAMSKDINEWAEETDKALGRSDEMLREMALSFHKLFGPSAETAGQAADLSKQFSALASDIAAFQRITDEEAADKLFKGLAGSTRGLKELGITMTETEVNNRALAMGLASTSKELTEQDKILARASLLWEKTAHMQGEATKQAGDFGSSVAAMNDAIQDLAEAVGKFLVPALKMAAEFTTAIVDGWLEIWGDAGKVIGEQMARLKFGDKAVDEALARIREAEALARSGAAANKDATDILGDYDETLSATGKSAAELALQQDKLVQQAIELRNAAFAQGGERDDLEAANELESRYKALGFAIRQAKIELSQTTMTAAAAAEANEALDGALSNLERQYMRANTALQEHFDRLVQIKGIQHELNQLATDQAINDLAGARGDFGVMTDDQKDLVDIENQLARDRLNAAQRLLELEDERASQALAGHLETAAFLDMEIEKQKILKDLVEGTSAEQILAQQQVAAMVGEIKGTVSSSFSELLKGLRDEGDKFDFGAWGANFIRRLSDSVIDRKVDDLVDGIFSLFGFGGKKQEVQTLNAQVLNIMGAGLGFGTPQGPSMGIGGLGGGGGGGSGGWLQSAWQGVTDFFGGFFAEGGFLPRGMWGIAGENGEAEIITGGRHGATVTPASQMGPPVQNFYIQTPDADSFRKSQRQVMQDARRGLNG